MPFAKRDDRRRLWAQVNGQGRGLWGHDATLRTSSVREFVYKRDFDENGVLYWLGTGACKLPAGDAIWL